MIGYRVYLMDWHGVHIEDVVELMAPSEDEAMRATSACRARPHWELWQGDRLIRKSATMQPARLTPLAPPSRTDARRAPGVTITRQWLISHHSRRVADA